MPHLTPPIEQVHQSFLAAMAEFRAEGRGDRQDETMIGAEIRRHGSTWSTVDGFSSFVAELRAQALEETPRPVLGPVDHTVVGRGRRLSRPDRHPPPAHAPPARVRRSHRL